MTGIIAVGYTTRTREDVESLPLPEFKAPANYGEEAAAKNIDAQKEKFLAGVASTPHYGELATLCMADLAHKRVFEPAKPKKGKPAIPLEVQAGTWILEKWGHAFPLGVAATFNAPPVIFVGFDMRTFLKLVGLRSVEAGSPLPLALWYSNSDHRDIGKALTGEDSWQGLPGALQRLFATPLPGYHPQRDAELDLKLTVDALSRLGMVV